MIWQRNIFLRMQDIKNSFGKKFVDRLPKTCDKKVLNVENYRANYKIIINIINEICRISIF